ncbi:MAG: hypothetical protein H3C34_15780 [Caldilineaceae bacterium]|nr:hypothetical protein [Caldilineaceae bacterium]
MQRRISNWAREFNLTVVPCEERPDRPQGDLVYRVKDLFTTFSGSWEPTDAPGGCPTWARESYLRPWGAPDYFDDAGGDHNLFARVLDLDGNPVKTRDLIIAWSDGFHLLGEPDFSSHIKMTMTPKDKSGWANQPIWNSFVPERGERGAWCWCPQGASDVVSGGGLPDNLHISTFVVWQAERRQPDVTTETGGGTATGPAEDVEILRRAAWQAQSLPYSGETSFVRYARQHNLGAPLTAELTAGTIRLQGFTGGIVYMPAGDASAMTHTAW